MPNPIKTLIEKRRFADELYKEYREQLRQAVQSGNAVITSKGFIIMGGKQDGDDQRT